MTRICREHCAMAGSRRRMASGVDELDRQDAHDADVALELMKTMRRTAATAPLSACIQEPYDAELMARIQQPYGNHPTTGLHAAP